MTSPEVGGDRVSESDRKPALIELGSEGPPLTAGAGSRFRGDGGVAAALSRWRVQSRQEVPPPRRLPAPNFVTLNQEAVKSGHVTAKQLREYRERMGAVKHSPAPRAHRGGASQRPQVPDITFGVKNRAPSPLFDILSHEYARRWTQENLKSRSEHERRNAVKCLSFAHTRTSLLRTNTALPHINTHTRARYAQVGPALDTFRKRRTGHQVKLTS
ncbi:cilia- and flagella-associated protein 77 isoform X2 [Syngnathoides biaculeatus]|uniref:cilia- and flagella-associated protein 77 isoform X2 n=1 Tax=Syngnathoides biaculeatus TaxID=300417 RepID=UPI002ADE5026|nr:cilia- and flagella-associated protein 77 isoform X2 [Syngnathoides biaculeatus]